MAKGFSRAVSVALVPMGGCSGPGPGGKLPDKALNPIVALSGDSGLLHMTSSRSVARSEFFDTRGAKGLPACPEADPHDVLRCP
jgi:hypothetical protein